MYNNLKIQTRGASFLDDNAIKNVNNLLFNLEVEVEASQLA